MINVSRVLQSKNFMQSFTVHRKKAHWVKGKLVQTEDTLTFQGVVNNANPKEILQIPEGDRVSGMMVFYSQSEMFVTRAWGTESQADYGTSDELEWQGDRYRVVTVNTRGDYGYFKAYAAYMEGT